MTQNNKFLKFDDNNYIGLLDISLIRLYENYWVIDDKYNKKFISKNEYGICIKSQKINEIFLLNHLNSDFYLQKNKNLDFINYIGFKIIDFNNFNSKMLPQISVLEKQDNSFLEKKIGKYSRRIFIKKPVIFNLFDVIGEVQNGFIVNKYIIPDEYYIQNIINLINKELSLDVIYNKEYDKFLNYILLYSYSDFEIYEENIKKFN